MASCPAQLPPLRDHMAPRGNDYPQVSPRFRRIFANALMHPSVGYSLRRHSATPTSYFRYSRVSAASRRNNAFRDSLPSVERRDPPRSRVIPTQWASIAHCRKFRAFGSVSARARALGSGVSPSSSDGSRRGLAVRTRPVSRPWLPSHHALPQRRYNPLMH